MLLLGEKISNLEKEKEKDDSNYKSNYENYDWRLRATKRDVIKRLFLEPADTTYITARWHFLKGMHFEFYWSAHHAIEKYLKAIILFNNQGTKKLGHDIVKAYSVVSKIAGEKLLPQEFPRVLLERISHITSISDMSRLHYKGVEEYIRNVSETGGANSRYAMTNPFIYTTDLYCFDLTIFCLRRIAEDLNVSENREELEINPDKCPCRYAFLEKVLSNPEHQLNDITSKVNYFLVPKPNTSEYLKMGLGVAFSNSALFNNIFETSNSDDPMNVRISKDISEWILENVQLNRSFEREIIEYADPSYILDKAT